MIKELELSLRPGEERDEQTMLGAVCRKLGLAEDEVGGVLPLRRSLDARRGQPTFKVRVRVYLGEPPPPPAPPEPFPEVGHGRVVVVVGCGPAGLFAALRLVQRGFRPVLLERGKEVQARRRDLRVLHQAGVVDADSNYCFGEGGAGTYSDGKLFTRATGRGDVGQVLSLLCQHGASPDILVDAHPHVGSNRLPGIVRALRQTLLQSGAEVRFGARVTDLLVRPGGAQAVRGVVLDSGEEVTGEAVVLATGHSARDIYELLLRRGVTLQAKPFAMGVRIEHPQALIDSAQYRVRRRDPGLPPAAYNLACQADGLGVYSFCMCPGGMVVPAATAPEELVLNGMSLARRGSPLANAGLVVSVGPEQWRAYKHHGVFAGLAFQRSLEQAAYQAGGGGMRAPAQRAQDFVAGKTGGQPLPASSYRPGITPAPLHELLPGPLARRLAGGLQLMARKLRGFLSEEALLLGVETRTSAPVRIPRDPTSLMHPCAPGLFPAGEGAGYAGGIVSSALDGQTAAEAVARYLG